jgi:predicted nucleic-acid-binding Zn-ribbon protein
MMDHKWNDFKCPVCGGSNFTLDVKCDIPVTGGLSNSIRINGGPKVLKAEVRECKGCGYLVFKRIYN